MAKDVLSDEQMRELVKESGLDWQRGYLPLFDGDPTNRYAVLINAALAAAEPVIRAEERERCAVAAWAHYMDTCRKRLCPPADFEHWNATSAIRSLEAASKEEGCEP